MGSFKHPRAFDPLDLEIIDRVYEAAWAQIEARECDRDTGRLEGRLYSRLSCMRVSSAL